MISIDEKKVDHLMSIYKKDIEKQTREILRKLRTRLAGTRARDQKAYINALIDKGVALILAPRSDIAAFKTEFSHIKKITDSRADMAFKDAILSDLGYSKLRTHFYPAYFNQLGIKSCVYCNSQLCVTAEGIGKNPTARYQVDHFISKSEYPCLSIALFNLYPVCASCNNKKGTKRLLFELYAEKAKSRKSPYSFSIENKDTTIAKYLSDRDRNVIKIRFDEPTALTGAHRLNDLFSIKGIYDTQIDIVEELILKRHIYDASYRSVLETTYPTLFPTGDKIIERLLVGNYTEEEELHLRPMAKFMQDIARQLELI
jgi:5-methylcytosine-specific restriction endonuclease McrA